MRKTKPPSPENTPAFEPAEIDLRSIIDVDKLQSIMDDFYGLTQMVTAILDLEGNVIEATGWQDICRKFHRVNPDTARKCKESDTYYAGQLKPGEYYSYRCKNGLEDVVTPLYIDGKHLGNIYTGQFFYDDEQIDKTFFIEQAASHGFDQAAYLQALERVPRYNRQTVQHLMNFLVKFAAYVSEISLANVKLQQEIAERKQTQKALAISETQLRTLIRTIPDLVWLKDPEGVYLTCNSRFENFFGAKEKNIVGKTDYDFLDKNLADFFREHDLASVKKGGPRKNEELVTFAEDGHQETLETIKTPIFQDDGGLIGVLGIGRDITERKQNEEALMEFRDHLEELVHQRTAQLEAANKELAAFSYSVSHDLRAPLRAINGYTRILMEDYAACLDDEGRRVCSIISSSAENMGQLIDDLLSFSHIGRASMQPTLVDMATLVGSIFHELTTEAERKRIDFKLADLPDAFVDALLIRHVWTNLLSNAIKFSSRRERAFITVEGKQAKGRSIYRVADNGAGFDMRYADKLFGVFQRLHGTRDFEGTGVGLAIVHRIVNRHGGQIHGMGTIDQGAVFEFSLPSQAGNDAQAGL